MVVHAEDTPVAHFAVVASIWFRLLADLAPAGWGGPIFRRDVALHKAGICCGRTPMRPNGHEQQKVIPRRDHGADFRQRHILVDECCQVSQAEPGTPEVGIDEHLCDCTAACCSSVQVSTDGCRIRWVYRARVLRGHSVQTSSEPVENEEVVRDEAGEGEKYGCPREQQRSIPPIPHPYHSQGNFAVLGQSPFLRGHGSRGPLRSCGLRVSAVRVLAACSILICFTSFVLFLYFHGLAAISQLVLPELREKNNVAEEHGECCEAELQAESVVPGAAQAEDQRPHRSKRRSRSEQRKQVSHTVEEHHHHRPSPGSGCSSCSRRSLSFSWGLLDPIWSASHNSGVRFYFCRVMYFNKQPIKRMDAGDKDGQCNHCEGEAFNRLMIFLAMIAILDGA
mmetsp:Transcript_27490/g.69334  ORF Transcript_27490/g.69334 Transcript_27490/m.69334 type:complete len:394 (-) Transcript_27490:33-1214(-)